MPSEVITIGSNFGISLGLAVFIGIPGRRDLHSHWTHQIAIDLDGGAIECLCEGQVFKGSGVFVPAGHVHSVHQGRQINLFFDTSVEWLDEAFSGAFNSSCARVLDRDTLQAIQSCFHHGADLKAAIAVFSSAFELRTHTRSDPKVHKDWQDLMTKARELKQSTDSSLFAVYEELGGLFKLTPSQ